MPAIAYYYFPGDELGTFAEVSLHLSD